MRKRNALKLVLVGSVDHGKSTMIGRLFHDTDSLPDGKLEEIRAASEREGRDLEFGFIMDHLTEERERGITIDTAQAFFATDKRDYVIIDAPGHKEFLKNMITGASQADVAILICGAYEGVEEQTRRHAYVLKLLGIDQTIVAYNKMDLVGYDRHRFEEVQSDLLQFLERIGVDPRLEIPISAKLGDNVAGRSENMPWYEGPTILGALDQFEKTAQPVNKPVRFPIQDVYEVGGERLAVGRVESGTLERGAELTFLPGQSRRRIAEIRKYQETDLAKAEPGECIGVLFEKDGAKRGEVGCPPDSQPRLADTVQANVFWMMPEALHRGENLSIRCATQEKSCRVTSIRERIDSGTLEHIARDAEELADTEVGEVTIQTETPIVTEPFSEIPELGRFVLLRGQDVVGGGIVTGS
ncbi:MAG: sulfate adenylyltransferase subunit 1 [Candidatus Brocadiia bacterium]